MYIIYSYSYMLILDLTWLVYNIQVLIHANSIWPISWPDHFSIGRCDFSSVTAYFPCQIFKGKYDLVCECMTTRFYAGTRYLPFRKVSKWNEYLKCSVDQCMFSHFIRHFKRLNKFNQKCYLASKCMTSCLIQELLYLKFGCTSKDGWSDIKTG
jgi:hypothetical protein